MVDPRESALPGGPKVLGQFFTPRPVVDACFDLLLAAGMQPGPATRIVDPACGEGVFLQVAEERGLAAPDRLFGCDRDPRMARRWAEQGLTGAGLQLFTRDGLYAGAAAPGFECASFDAVVGNPPFHGHGLRDIGRETPDAPARPLAGSDPEELLEALAGFDVWRLPCPSAGKLSRADLERLQRYPIELLFLERFLQLARPSGLVGIILPEGVFANARLASVRRWLWTRARVLAVLEIPRRAFCGTGTTALTCLAILRKRSPVTVELSPAVLIAVTRITAVGTLALGPAAERSPPAGQTLEASRFRARESPGRCSARLIEGGLAPAGGHEWPAGTPAPRLQAPAPVLSPAGALRCVMDGKPLDPTHGQAVPTAGLQDGARLDPGFYDPRFLALQARLGRSAFKTRRLGYFVELVTYGAIVVGRRCEDAGGVRLVHQGDLRPGGVLWPVCRRVREGSAWDRLLSRVRHGDLLLARSGEGGLGARKMAVARLQAGSQPANVGSFVDLIRLEGIDPWFVLLFLRGRFGHNQIRRVMNGVGAPNISFQELRDLEVPWIEELASPALGGGRRLMAPALALHNLALDGAAGPGSAGSLAYAAYLRLSGLAADLASDEIDAMLDRPGYGACVPSLARILAAYPADAPPLCGSWTQRASIALEEAEGLDA